MPTINGKACVVNGKPIDKVFSDGRQVYGRNLLTGIDHNIYLAPGWFYLLKTVDKKFIKVGESLCFSAFINNSPYEKALAKGSAYCDMQAKDVSGNIFLEKVGTPINFDADGVSQVSFVVPEKTDSILLFIVTSNMGGNAHYGYPKLEFGSVATPWSPAPEDVM